MGLGGLREAEWLGRRSGNNSKWERKKTRRGKQPNTLYSRRGSAISVKGNLYVLDRDLVQDQPETTNDPEMVDMQNDVSWNLQSGDIGIPNA